MAKNTPAAGEPESIEKNVLGTQLHHCCFEPMTGYFRDGFCHTDASDRGSHTVCAVMTDEFLAFSKAAGNDLSTPMPQYEFPGLKAGDQWCLCAMRWKEAYDAGKAPGVRLLSTHHSVTRHVPLAALAEYAVDDEG